jgi:hypothetical protein
MADYTIIRTAAFNNRSDVVAEFESPIGDNAAGIAWEDAVAEVRLEEQSMSINPRKVGDQAYLVQLAQGKIIELGLSVSYDANLPDADKLLIIDAAVVDAIAIFSAEFTNIYNFYGTERTV